MVQSPYNQRARGGIAGEIKRNILSFVLFCFLLFICKSRDEMPMSMLNERNIQQVTSAGKRDLTKRGNLPPAAKLAKPVTSSKRGKTCCLSQTRENLPPAPNVGKLGSSA